MRQPRKVLVIGVGRFGGALVDELWQSGCEVVVVDKQPEAIESVRAKTSAAFVADATEPAVLENIGARDMDVAVSPLARRSRAWCCVSRSSLSSA